MHCSQVFWQLYLSLTGTLASNHPSSPSGGHLHRSRPEKILNILVLCIPANTPPVFPGLRPRIWPHLLRLATKTMPDRFLGFGFCAGYPGGGSTVSSVKSPRSVESPESVTGGGDPDVGVTGSQAFDRVWNGVREPGSFLVAHETALSHELASKYLSATFLNQAAPFDIA